MRIRRVMILSGLTTAKRVEREVQFMAGNQAPARTGAGKTFLILGGGSHR